MKEGRRGYCALFSRPVRLPECVCNRSSVKREAGMDKYWCTMVGRRRIVAKQGQERTQRTMPTTNHFESADATRRSTKVLLVFRDEKQTLYYHYAHIHRHIVQQTAQQIPLTLPTGFFFVGPLSLFHPQSQWRNLMKLKNSISFQRFTIFIFSLHMRRYWICVKLDNLFFQQISIFRGYHKSEKKGFFQSCLPLSVEMITFERIIRLKCALVHFIRAKKERTSSLRPCHVTK